MRAPGTMLVIVGSDEGIDDVGLGEGSAVGCAVGKPLGAKVS